jgi:hypothetical protein
MKILPDPDAIPPRTEKGLSELFREIRSTVGEEAQIVQVVFPNPPLVMQVFLQRVFAQSVSKPFNNLIRRSYLPAQIQQYMEGLLNTASSLSTLAFLRILQLVHIQTASLVDDLKAFELTTTITRSPSDSADVRRSLGLPISTSSSSVSGSSTAVTTSVSLSSMLETAFEELFVPYAEGPRYLEKESKSLSELYVDFLVKYTRYHVRFRLNCLYGYLTVCTGEGTQGEGICIRPHGEPIICSRGISFFHCSCGIIK